MILHVTSCVASSDYQQQHRLTLHFSVKVATTNLTSDMAGQLGNKISQLNKTTVLIVHECVVELHQLPHKYSTVHVCHTNRHQPHRTASSLLHT